MPFVSCLGLTAVQAHLNMITLPTASLFALNFLQCYATANTFQQSEYIKHTIFALVASGHCLKDACNSIRASLLLVKFYWSSVWTMTRYFSLLFCKKHKGILIVICTHTCLFGYLISRLTKIIFYEIIFSIFRVRQKHKRVKASVFTIIHIKISLIISSLIT